MISLDQNSRDPLYVQIYDSIRRDITENALKPGEKLMPIRKLAESLDVSRNTVENAYAKLLTEGYVTSRSGSGYVVCNVDFRLFQKRASKRTAPQRAEKPNRSPHPRP